jgi:ubiquinone/menaquinone biosynthesis C-methylase UbiE
MTENDSNRFELIFNRHAEEYHELVSAEDWQGNLPRALAEITSFEGKTVIELGAGTGRVTTILARWAGKVLAFDVSRHMLDKATSNMQSQGLTNVTVAVADNKSIPLADASADVVIEGWSFGYTVSQRQSYWRNEADSLISESMRLLRPGGTLIIVETLGTGFRMPAAPGSVLPVFYGYLERQLGFAASWVRTDYRFHSLTEARRLVELFFGRMVDYDLVAERNVIVPECTGIWWREHRREKEEETNKETRSFQVLPS